MEKPCFDENRDWAIRLRNEWPWDCWFGSLGLLLGKQALKSIKNNVDIVSRCRRQQSGVRLLRVLSTAAKQGLKLSRFEGYRRYGAKNARGHFERRGATWEVYREEKERSLTFSYDNETRNFVKHRTRFYWIIKRQPKIRVLTRGWVM